MAKKQFFKLALLVFAVTFFAAKSGFAQPVFSIQNKKDACGGLQNGSFDINVTSGTGSLSAFIFNTGHIPNPIVMPLSMGINSVSGLVGTVGGNSTLVVVSDDNGSSNTLTTIFSISGVSASVDGGFPINNSSCLTPDGQIHITASGGSGSYSYSWTSTNGFTSNSQNISGLAGGGYTVVVSDNGTNCTFSLGPIAVSDPSPLISNVGTTTPSVCNGSNGTVTLNTSGGASVVYSVYKDGNPIGVTLNGTGGMLSFTIPAAELTPGTYTFTIEAADGACTPVFMNGSAVIFVPSINLSSTTTSNTRCVAPFNGSIDLTVAGSAGPYTYAWSGPGGFSASTQDISALQNGTYNVVVTHTASGCQANASIAVGNSTPTITLSNTVVNNTHCVSPFTGSIDLTVAGSAGPFTYAWTGPGGFTASTQDINAVRDGSYDVTVTDNTSGCSALATIVVGDAKPTITLTNTVVNNTKCVAPFTGSIDLTVAGSAGPFTYAWTGPGGFTASTEDINALLEGSYDVTVTDNASGCFATATIVVGNSKPTLTLSNVVTNNTRCVAPFNGAINLTVAGSAGPFTYAWTGPGGFTATVEDISALLNGSYDVTVTDTNSGCTASATIVVGNSTPTITLTNSVTNNSRCTAPFNGAINLTVAGSAGPFSYSWTGPGGFTSAVEDISALLNGNYDVTVTDTNTGCTASETIVVGNATPAITLTNSVTNNTRCVAPFNGAINLTVAGSAGPFTYSWTGPGGFTAAVEDISTLNAGTYDVTVTDTNSGCTATSSISVGNAAPTISLSNSVTNNTRCVAPFNGAINLTVAGSAGPFTFLWTGPGGFTASVEDISSLDDGTYDVTVTDTNSGCTATASIAVGNSAPTLTITRVITSNARCTAPFNGAINITMAGSVGPFTYAWTGPGGFTANTEDISNLQSGVYHITVTDNGSGCFLNRNYTVGNSAPTITLSSSVIDNTKCAVPFDGAIDLTVAGSAGPFTYAWTGPGGFTASTEDISLLVNGNYDVTVTDSNSGCTASATIAVGNAASPITLTNSVTNNTRCVAPFDGAINLTVAGSAGPFTYSWTGPGGFTAAVEDISTLNAGTYDITVTDTNSGCTANASISVGNATSAITLTSAVIDNSRCASPFNGAINLSVAGSAGPFTYSWTGPGGFSAATEDISNLVNGTYDVTVTDTGSGCSANASINVGNASPTITLTNTVIDNSRCIAPFNGEIDLTVAGTAGPFTFSWTGPGGFTSAVEDITALQNGTYDVTVTDNTSGCTTTASIAVGNSTPTISLSNSVTNNTRCVAAFNGAINLTVTGSAGPFTYDWTGPGGFTASAEDISSLQSGTYDVTVTDNVSGCTATASISVADNSVIPSVSASTIVDNDKCVAPFNGAILITVSPAGAYSFAWTGPGGFTSTAEDITTLASGTYDVTITNNVSGCQFSTSFNVGNTAPSISIVTNAVSDNSACNAPFNGAILVTMSPAGSYSYAWSGPNGFTSTSEDISGLEQGDYTLTATNTGLGCTATSTITVGDATPVVSLGSQTVTDNTSCLAPFNGEITVTGSGPGPFNFSWTGPNGFTGSGATISNLEAGDYIVTVTDLGISCSDSYTITVGEASPSVTATLDSSTDNTSCVAPFTGSVSITPSGTTGPYTFDWIGPNGFTATTEDISDLEDGDYTVTITDSGLGCVGVQTFTVNDSKPVVGIDIISTTDNTSCVAPFDGAISVDGSGTAGPFTFDWVGPNGFTASVSAINSLEPGDYTVTITDTGLGCQGVFIVTVNDISAVPTITTSTSDNTTCMAPFDGAIDILTVSGTTGPWSFSWTGPNGFTSTSQSISALESGDYDVTVTDDLTGCNATYTVTVNGAISVPVVTTDVNDNTACLAPFDGSIDILSVSGTLGPWSFSWTGPNAFASTSQNISALEPGDYDVTVTDDITGCSATYTVTVNDVSPSPVITTNITDNTNCSAPFDGAIDILTISGTTGPWSFSWTGPNGFTSASQNISALESGDYDVTVTDDITGCNATYTVTVGSNVAVLAITQNVTNNTVCTAPYNGAIDITSVTGTVGPFDFDWTGPNGFTQSGAGLNSISNLEPGSYHVVITDSNLGCSGSFDIDVLDNSVGTTIALDGIINNTNCSSPFNGAINVTVGGTPGPFTISWTGPGAFTANSEDISNLPQGNYTILVTDDLLGCTATATYTVNSTATGCGGLNCFAYTITVVNNLTIRPTCNNQNNGQIALNVLGTTPGNYIIKLLKPADVTFSALTQIGPSGQYIFNGLSPGNYEYSVEDQAGNICVQPYSLPVESTVDAEASGFVDASCFGSATGQATITVLSGGNAPYEYSLDNGVNWTSFTSPHLITDLPPNGSYSILVRNDASDQCPDEVDVTINNANPQISVGLGTTSATCGSSDGAINITTDPSGGSGGTYTFKVDGIDASPVSNSFAGLAGGSHTLTVIDGSGCSMDFSITVPFPGLVPTSGLSSSSGDCVNGGTIFFFIDNPGSLSFQIGYTTDFFSEPINYSSAFYTPPAIPGDAGFVSIPNISRGNYYVWVKSSGAQCATRINSIPVEIGGPYQITFDIGCRDSNGDLHLSNIQGAPNTPYTYEAFGNGFTATGTLNVDPLFEATVSFNAGNPNELHFIDGTYSIWLSQDQTAIAGCVVSSEKLNPPIKALDTVFVQIPSPVSKYEKSFANYGTASRIIRIQRSGAGVHEYLLELVTPYGADPPNPVIGWDEIVGVDVRLDNLFSGLYTFSLRDEFGCMKSYPLEILLDESIVVPNLFTPNGDGANDFFEILNLPESGSQIVITNRWGKEVFSSKNYNPGTLWDGKDTPDGVYYYRLSVSGGKIYTGWVEILRGVKP